MECKDASGRKCDDKSLPPDCPPEGIFERIVFKYSVENDGSKEVRITTATSRLNGGQAVEFVDHLEKNPVSFRSTSNIVNFGEVSLNVCSPIEISNAFEIEGNNLDGTTCTDTAVSSFNIN